MMTDPIADMLTRLRNAAMVRHATTTIPFSKLKVSIAEILKAEGFITDFAINDEGQHRAIDVTMKYTKNREAAFAGLKRASRPGRRWYVGHGDIPKVRNGLGVAVMSTSKGVMTDTSAREAKVGGEVLFEVW